MKNTLSNIRQAAHVLASFSLSLFFSTSFLALFFWGTGHPAFGETVSLSWNANTESNLAGYYLYHGTDSGSYGAPIKLGIRTSYALRGLSNKTHYFALTAYDTAGNESDYSVEVNKAFSEPKSGFTGEDLLFHASTGNREITLSWKNPPDSKFAGVRIIYRTDRFPKDIHDGELLWDVDGNPDEEMTRLYSNLFNGITYYFLLASYDKDRNFYFSATDSAKTGILTENRNDDLKDEPSGGCGMVMPRGGGGNSGPEDTAGILSIIGIITLMLSKSRLRELLKKTWS